MGPQADTTVPAGQSIPSWGHRQAGAPTAEAHVGLEAARVTRIALLAIPMMSQPSAIFTRERAQSAAVL